jgi:hypothetical protein
MTAKIIALRNQPPRSQEVVARPITRNEAVRRIIHYKDYEIEPFESSPGRWRARVRRKDGRKIKNETDQITTGGMESLSANAVIAVAIEMIDDGGMD